MSRRIEKMPDLTEEEYDVLDEKWIKNPSKYGPNRTGFFVRRKVELAAQSARYTNCVVKCLAKHLKSILTLLLRNSIMEYRGL
jgi:hypothetical protein